jgi:hypothetical protein
MRKSDVEQDRLDFAEFYTSARDDCLRVVLVNVGDRNLAEDLVAEGFTRAWMSWRKVREHPAPRAWVVRTALNAHVAFINATLACGAATVTGHVEINRTETTKITGRPVTVKLSKGYGKSVGAKWATARWTLYVNSRTFLPVRIYGSTETFGGPAATHTFSSVTNVRWLPPTAANIAMTLVTIPAGFLRVRSPSDQ